MPDALIRYKGQELSLPVLEGTEGKPGMDIAGLQGKLGLMTFDPGFGNTAEMQSQITFIDGDQAILRYRGYPIEELAEQASFLEVAYLLGEGELPTPSQYNKYQSFIIEHSQLSPEIRSLLESYPSEVHPMQVLSSVIPVLESFYGDAPSDPTEELRWSTARLIAKLPTLIAWSYRTRQGLELLPPRADLGYTENFLYMMFGEVRPDYKPDPVAAAALNTLLILHADHTQNCSATAVRLVGSSGANLLSSIGAGLHALFGPLHGGANQQVVEMLEKIVRDEGNVDLYVNRAKQGTNGFRLMGFGHRVYKNLDPRAKIIKAHADAVLKVMGIDDPMLEVAQKLVQVALADDYFVSRRLYPNVDFYSGILYQAMGFPTDMFTVLFALGRLPGWLAQWREMKTNPDSKLTRPRQIYTGAGKRSYVPLEER